LLLLLVFPPGRNDRVGEGLFPVGGQFKQGRKLALTLRRVPNLLRNGYPDGLSGLLNYPEVVNEKGAYPNGGIGAEAARVVSQAKVNHLEGRRLPSRCLRSRLWPVLIRLFLHFPRSCKKDKAISGAGMR